MRGKLIARERLRGDDPLARAERGAAAPPRLAALGHRADVCLAVGFALIECFGWDDVTPGAIAVLLGATGIGNLVVLLDRA